MFFDVLYLPEVYETGQGRHQEVDKWKLRADSCQAVNHFCGTGDLL